MPSVNILHPSRNKKKQTDRITNEFNHSTAHPCSNPTRVLTAANAPITTALPCLRPARMYQRGSQGTEFREIWY